MKATVIYHSADFDGLFSGRIAKKFLGTEGVEYIGWDFKDEPLKIPSEGTIYIIDLPVDRVFGFKFGGEGHLPWLERVIWIDHHKSSIETHNSTIAGYRIDGVAACRLAYQWFFSGRAEDDEPIKQDFIDRKVTEPCAVMLAGEYDIFDRRRMSEDPRVKLLQLGLKTIPLNDSEWNLLLDESTSEEFVESLMEKAEIASCFRVNEYTEVINTQGFTVDFEGIKFLACCSHELDIRSQLFEAGIRPEHEALLGFTFTGNDWRVSMYQIEGKSNVDVLSIAKKFDGGGHAGACGFRVPTAPSFVK